MIFSTPIWNYFLLARILTCVGFCICIFSLLIRFFIWKKFNTILGSDCLWLFISSNRLFIHDKVLSTTSQVCVGWSVPPLMVDHMAILIRWTMLTIQSVVSKCYGNQENWWYNDCSWWELMNDQFESLHKHHHTHHRAFFPLNPIQAISVKIQSIMSFVTTFKIFISFFFQVVYSRRDEKGNPMELASETQGKWKMVQSGVLVGPMVSPYKGGPLLDIYE